MGCFFVVDEVKSLSFNRMLLTDLEQVSGFVLLDASTVFDNISLYGYKSLKLSDFKLSVDSKGKSDYYFVNVTDDTYFHKKYFDNWQKFEKMFNCGIMFLYKPNCPLVIVLGNCVDEMNKEHGVLCYVIAHKVRGV